MQNFLRAATALTVPGGIAAFVHLASLPGADGLSPIRLFSLAGILLLVIFSGAVFFKVRSADFVETLTAHIQRLKSAVFLSFAGFTLAWAAWLAVLYKNAWLLYSSAALYERSVPLLLLGAWTSFVLGMALVLPHFRPAPPLPNVVRNTALLLMAGIAAIAVFMSATGIGFTYDLVGLNWGPAGVPITFAQVNLVLAIGFLLFFAFAILRAKIRFNLARGLFVLDGLVFIGLWAAAVALWSAQTISPSHFSPAVSAPNFEYYPYSDAALFDKASYRMFSGVGLGDATIRRPLYAGLLAVFHIIGGVEYDGTVAVQILLLAFIPALLYLLTKKLSNHLAGFLAGGLVILREANAIQLSGSIATAHAKLMMSDLPALLGIAALTYACILFFEKPKQDGWLALVIGGVLGLLLLVRAQSLVLLPLILLIILLREKFRKPAWISAALVAAGLAAIILPWAWRNWMVTGSPALGDGGEKVLMARNYSLNVTEYPQPLPNETDAEFSDRLTRQILAYIHEHPGDVAFFISNHFLRGAATSAVFLAPAYSTATPAEIIRHLPFWEDWTGSLPRHAVVPLAANLALLAFGIGLAARNKSVSWLPLLFFLVYQAGNAIARTSGWRFSLPVDWVVIVYISIGLAHFPSRMTFKNEADAAPSSPESKRRFAPAVFLLLCLAGMSLPLADRAAAQKDVAALTVQAQTALLAQGILQPQHVSEFPEYKNAVVLSGVALYPRYFRPNGNVYLADMPQDARYLHFWLLHKNDSQVILLREKPPEAFPHASTVTVFGCADGNHISALAVVLHIEAEISIVLQNPIPAAFSCP